MPNRSALLVLIGLCVILWGLARACAPHPAASSPRATVYVPIAEQGAPRCNRWRGDDWLPCVLATLTAEARVSSTPTATFRPWPTPTPTRASPTWAPQPYEPLGGRAWLPITADVSGPGRQCSAAWAPNGSWYLAGHCLPSNPLLMRVSGVVVTAWQRDRDGRDLAQVVAGDGGQAPALAVLAPGDALTMRPATGDVAAAYQGAAWARGVPGGYELWPTTFDGARPVGVACVASAAGRIVTGASGAGVYRSADGALGGIVIAAEVDPRGDVWCGAEQRVIIEWTP